MRGYGRATPYLFLAPYLALFLLFVVGPAVFGLWMSLHDWDFQLPGKPFVGLQNYKDLFDPLSATAEPFWHGMRATGIFTVASVPFLVAVPLGLAVLLNRKFPGRTFFRAVYFAPYVLGVAVIGLMFRYILDTTFGILNAFLGVFGISEIGWTTEQPWAFVALVAVTVWWTAGFNAIIYLAGLQDIPAEQYEAAELDGASTWQQFRHVTLPGLRPVTVFIVVITLLASANMFGQALLITQGGPGDTTTTALMVITDTGFSQFRMGQAAAMSYLLAICLAIVALVVFRLMKERKS
ncbi:carbohydrate ABC transporter permease [Kribbella catacumbae]|uniref:carbohydrate ABC transporter permease n=1 Tax=Kribbella catacumbae TaxID=460086 RepID=UPI00036039EA|nr:sugar ABC transporter permease [Kribbella catacumbae]